MNPILRVFRGTMVEKLMGWKPQPSPSKTWLSSISMKQVWEGLSSGLGYSCNTFQYRFTYVLLSSDQVVF